MQSLHLPLPAVRLHLFLHECLPVCNFPSASRQCPCRHWWGLFPGCHGTSGTPPQFSTAPSDETLCCHHLIQLFQKILLNQSWIRIVPIAEFPIHPACYLDFDTSSLSASS